jgi:hypothetical protein
VAAFGQSFSKGFVVKLRESRRYDFAVSGFALCTSIKDLLGVRAERETVAETMAMMPVFL